MNKPQPVITTLRLRPDAPCPSVIRRWRGQWLR